MLRRQQFFAGRNFSTSTGIRPSQRCFLPSFQCGNSIALAMFGFHSSCFRYQSSSNSNNVVIPSSSPSLSSQNENVKPQRRFLLKAKSVPDVPILPEARRSIVKMYALLIGLVLLSCGVTIGVARLIKAFPEQTSKSNFFMDGMYLSCIVGFFVSVMCVRVAKGANAAIVRAGGFISLFVVSGLFWAYLISGDAKKTKKQNNGNSTELQRYILYAHALACWVCFQFGVSGALMGKVSLAFGYKFILWQTILLYFIAVARTADDDHSDGAKKPQGAKKKKETTASIIVFPLIVGLLFFVLYMSCYGGSIAISTFLRVKKTKFVVPRDVITLKYDINNQKLCNFKQINVEQPVGETAAIAAAFEKGRGPFELLNVQLLGLAFADPELFYWTLPEDSTCASFKNNSNNNDDGNLLPDSVNVFYSSIDSGNSFATVSDIGGDYIVDDTSDGDGGSDGDSDGGGGGDGGGD